MKTHEQRADAATAVRELIESVAGAQLRNLPGVYHVAEGLRHRRGRLTRELCMRVYVRDKLPHEYLSPAERIPQEIDGIPTDVNVQSRAVHPQAEDRTRYRPVKGGIMVSNGIVALQPDGTPGIEEGTFGITATRISDKDIMLLSCAHVLMANGAIEGKSPIFQPSHDPNPFLKPADLPFRPGKKAENMIAILSKGVLNSRVDAAIARIDVSSCCRSCGIDWRDEIVELSDGALPPSNKLLGQRQAVIGDQVFKRGARGRTEGTVFCTNLPNIPLTIEGKTTTFTGQIGIEGLGLIEPFSFKGDSGSVVVTDDGFVVGLLFAGDGFGALNTNTSNMIKAACPAWHQQNMSIANHISDVTSALGITINLDRSTHHSAGVRGTPPFATMNDAERERFALARERVRTDPAGAWIWAVAEQHREEVVDLVRHHRPVTVAWHRAGGPALLAEAFNTLRAGGDTLPVPTDGGTLESALIRIGDALRTHGSPELRESIETHRTLLLAAVRESKTVTEFLERLRPFALSRGTEFLRVGVPA